LPTGTATQLRAPRLGARQHDGAQRRRRGPHGLRAIRWGREGVGKRRRQSDGGSVGFAWRASDARRFRGGEGLSMLPSHNGSIAIPVRQD
jgi:hypothetical protein